jgi:cytochrome c oxidase cbb3-type subunit IV
MQRIGKMVRRRSEVMHLHHEQLVAFAKIFGLFYLLAFFIAATLHALWPANKAQFDHAAEAILDHEDRPWE